MGEAMRARSPGYRCIPLLVALAGCGGTAPTVAGTEEVLETSREERPRWMGAPECPDGKVCAQGSRTRAAALEHARTDAHNDALKDFARRLETRAKTRFAAARQEGRLPEAGEAPDVDQAIKDFFAAASRIQVQDVHVEDFWWRRFQVMGSDGTYHHYYDYAVLLSMPAASWRRAVQAVIDRQRNEARAAGHAQLVEELDRFAADVLEEE